MISPGEEDAISWNKHRAGFSYNFEANLQALPLPQTGPVRRLLRAQVVLQLVVIVIANFVAEEGGQPDIGTSLILCSSSWDRAVARPGGPACTRAGSLSGAGGRSGLSARKSWIRAYRNSTVHQLQFSGAYKY